MQLEGEVDVVGAGQRMEDGTSTWDDSFLLLKYQIQISPYVEQVVIWPDAFAKGRCFTEVGGEK